MWRCHVRRRWTHSSWGSGRRSLHHADGWASHWSRATHGCWSSHRRWTHSWAAHTDTTTGTCQSWRRLVHHWSHLNRPSHGLSSAHATHLSAFTDSSSSLRRRCFCTHGYNVIASQENEAKSSLDFSLLVLWLLRLNLSELLRVCQDQVHVFIKGYESANKSTGILNCHSNAIVYPLQKFTTSRHIYFIL